MFRFTENQIFFRSKGKSYVPSLTLDGKFDTKLVGAAIRVDYETREGSAKVNKDFNQTSGSLVRFSVSIFFKLNSYLSNFMKFIF